MDEPKYTKEFELFWAAYPRKVAKADALKAWRQVKLEGAHALLEEVLARLEDHKRQPSWLKEHGAFIPYPATWLRQRRWEDDLSGPRIAPLVNPDLSEDPRYLEPRPEGTCKAWATCQGQDAGNGYCLACQVFLPVEKRLRASE